MPTFRKTVEIEAFQMTAQAIDMRLADAPAWLRVAIEDGRVEMRDTLVAGIVFKLHTQDGVTSCRYGDWIIRGAKGHLYPCKPDVFEETYDPVYPV